MDYALGDGLPRITPNPEHRESYIIAVFVADVIDKEALKTQSAAGSSTGASGLDFWGWSALRTAAVGLEKELISTNKAGGIVL